MFGTVTQRLTGARRSPPSRAFAVMAHQAIDYPPNFGQPCQLSGWGNVETATCPGYGDCVTAEEMAAKSRDGAFISEQDAIAFARQHRLLHGADLTEVMDLMLKTGIATSDGKTYHDGPYNSVDWTNRDVFCSAVAKGQVKLGIAHAQLNAAYDAGLRFINAFHADPNTDHCTGGAGYGTAEYFADTWKIPLGSQDPQAFGIIHFSWDEDVWISLENALANITSEAWLRNPTTPEAPQPLPPPLLDPPLPDPNL